MENIETLEKRLWGAADQLRANSGLGSNEYFMPVMGLIFLRHAFNRFLKVKAEIEPTLAKRQGVARPLMKEDFAQSKMVGFFTPTPMIPMAFSVGIFVFRSTQKSIDKKQNVS
jgi:HsdM N-terminal domain